MATAAVDKEYHGKSHVLVMTPGTRGHHRQENVVRIDRVPKSQLDLSTSHYQSNGPLTGIVINKKTKDLPQVTREDLEIDFTAFLHKTNNGCTKKQEQRILRFWFIPGAPSRSKHLEHAQAYFKLLIKPERFPTDYVSFIKKALQLARHFPTIARLELILRPLHQALSCRNTSGGSSDEEDNILEQARQRRERANQRLKKWARLDRSLSEDEEDSCDGSIDNYITVFTPAKYDYVFLPGIRVNLRPYLTFKVKAKCDVHVALSTLYGDTENKTYEILIGGWNNTKSVIRDGSEGHIIEEALTPKILNQHMFRAFWIRWGRRNIEVGLGNKLGEKVFLRTFIPSDQQYHINSMGVTTGPGSPGQWELVEKIVQENENQRQQKEEFYSMLRYGLLLEAKKRSVLELLGDAYPSRLNTANLRRLSKTKPEDVMMIVNILKSLAESGEVIGVQKGVWVMAHCSLQLKSCAFELVDVWPRYKQKDLPSMIIATSRQCEKLAVDASMDNRVTYARTTERGAVYAFTIGRIDGRVAIHVNLSEPFNLHSMNCLSSILEHFPGIEQAYLVGVGGAVPHFSDYDKHVRLGDVVVCLPSREKRPVYVHCDKVGPIKFRRRQFSVNAQWMTDDLLRGHVLKAKGFGESWRSGFRNEFERNLDRAMRALTKTDFEYQRPPGKTDKLVGLIDGEHVPIEHPRPTVWSGGSSKKPTSNFRFGPIGSGKTVSRNELLRMDFSAQYELCAFDTGSNQLLDMLQKAGIENYLVIRGMADYVDGTTKKKWQPHAALCAATFLKTFLTILPKKRY